MIPAFKMGSDESHFNVSLIVVRDKVTKLAVPTDHNFSRKSRSGIEPMSFCLPEALIWNVGGLTDFGWVITEHPPG